ncbi:MAG: Sec-independent protein translocase protein TatB [Gammaproteobacteria bacterium]|nr:Sec-independent protein translocase protein TatB [Gammaproteobacteria bacterium]MCZ6797139.1 Sec-independent protein translocase protein TatB [Gammaproteobacteria bacterium]
MFDMGFTEMMLIGIVALVVIGPERLPGVARTAGKYFTRLRNFMMDVRADVESELKADELREMLKKQQEELRSLKDVVSDVGKDLNLSEDIGVAEIKKSIEDAMPDLDTRLDPDPVPETKAEPKKSVKVSSKKKVAGKKASPKPKAAPKAKATPKKSKAASKLSPKAKAAPKKAKATPNRVKAVPETKVATKTRAKPKTTAKLKPETESGWASSIVLPGSPTDAD